jgi:hypothetical protein
LVRFVAILNWLAFMPVIGFTAFASPSRTDLRVNDGHTALGALPPAR